MLQYCRFESESLTLLVTTLSFSLLYSLIFSEQIFSTGYYIIDYFSEKLQMSNHKRI